MNQSTLEIVARIDHLLKEHHVSAARMMRELGFSSGLYTQWRQGLHAPSADKLTKIADYFGVPMDYILGRDPDFGASELRRLIIRALDDLETDALKRVLDYARFSYEQQEKHRTPQPTPIFPDL